jgi:hypothetical protein
MLPVSLSAAHMGTGCTRRPAAKTTAATANRRRDTFILYLPKLEKTLSDDSSREAFIEPLCYLTWQSVCPAVSVLSLQLDLDLARG